MQIKATINRECIDDRQTRITLRLVLEGEVVCHSRWLNDGTMSDDREQSRLIERAESCLFGDIQAACDNAHRRLYEVKDINGMVSFIDVMLMIRSIQQSVPKLKIQ